MKKFFTKLKQTLTAPFSTAKENSQAEAYAEQTGKQIGDLFTFGNDRYEVTNIEPYEVQIDQGSYQGPYGASDIV